MRFVVSCQIAERKTNQEPKDTRQSKNEPSEGNHNDDDDDDDGIDRAKEAV